MIATADGLSLGQLLGLLRRRWWLIGGLGAVVACAAFVWSNGQVREYASAAEVLVSFDASTKYVDPNGITAAGDQRRSLENELRFARSQVVASAVVDTLGYRPSADASALTEDADIIAFASTSPDPGAAAAEANLYAETFIRQRAQRQVAQYQEAVVGIEQVLPGLRDRYLALPADSTDPNIKSQRETLQSQVRYYEAQRDALLLSAQVSRSSGASIITRAEAPEFPVSPRPLRTSALAAMVGLMLGVGLAFALEFLDDTLRSKEDLERSSPGLALLGLVPKSNKDVTVSPALLDSHSLLGEAFRSLRTSVQFAGLRSPLRSLQVTSANPSEGKTTVTSNLAVALAQAGERVVLVDVDLRNPSVTGRFGLSNEVGLSNVMLGQVTVERALIPIDGLPNLRILPSGPLPGNPADFLWSANAPADAITLPKLIAHFVEQGCFVVVDCPPVLPVADSMTISRVVDATLIVASSGSTGSRELERALEQLTQVDARIIGTVLNNVSDGRGGYGYGYGRYGYGYGRRPRTRWQRILARVGLHKAPERPTIDLPPAMRPANRAAGGDAATFAPTRPPAPTPNGVATDGQIVVTLPTPPAPAEPSRMQLPQRQTIPPLDAPANPQRQPQAAAPDPAIVLGEPGGDEAELIRRLRAHLGVASNGQADPHA